MRTIDRPPLGWLLIITVAIFGSVMAPAQTLTAIHSFTVLSGSYTNGDGANPEANLAQGSDGNFYGTTYNGGDYGNGTVFEITSSGSLKTIHSFTALSGSSTNGDGANPEAGLIQGSDGNFYGTASQGGSYGNGTLFQITTSGSLTTIYPFSPLSYSGDLNPITGHPIPINNDGANPSAGLVQGSDGNFYGTTYDGGRYGNGTVFGITASGSLTTIYPFSSSYSGYFNPITGDPIPINNDGANPSAGLVQGSDGNFYGTTYDGGSYGNGTFFGITASGSLTNIYSFSYTADFNAINSDGANPRAALVQGNDGNFYGTTSVGGANGNGTVFEITSSGSPNTIHSFSYVSQNYPYTNSDGTNPLGGLVQGSDGNFYGTTRYGGQNGTGTIFRITASGSLTTLDSFKPFYDVYPAQSESDGANPLAGLVQGSDGNLYGTTEYGGRYGDGDTFGSGTVFKLPTGTFANQAGTFAALFDDDDGFVEITLGETGGFAGTIVLGGITYHLKGNFDPNGNFSGSIGPPPTPISLHIDLSTTNSIPGDYLLSGSVGNESFIASHAAHAAGQAVAEAGRYTILLTQTDASESVPQGTGYGTLIVGKNGLVTMTGRLADDTPLNISGILVGGSNGNQFLFFDPNLYNKKGFLAGSIVFEHLTGSDCDGSVEWMRPPGKSTEFYAQGFDTNLALKGAVYSKPGKGIVLPSFTAGILTISDGGLSAPLAEPVAVSPQGTLVVTGSNPDHIEINVNTTAGTISGSFMPPVSARPVSFSGVLYQNPALPGAGGFFIGPILNGVSLSGNVNLLP